MRKSTHAAAFATRCSSGCRPTLFIAHRQGRLARHQLDDDGRVTTAIAPGAASDTGTSIAIQPDGQIVVSGFCDMGGATGRDACVVRYNVDGSLDTTFDSDGRATAAIGPGTNSDLMYGLALQTDGKVVLSG